MSEQLNQLLADRAARLVYENFTGVEAEWWWERRIGGGIAICQTLDPEKLSEEIARDLKLPVSRVREIAARTLGLEDFEPLTLTFEVSGDETTREAASILAERSTSRRGISSGLYQQVEESVMAG